jgi:hypothetical protein
LLKVLIGYTSQPDGIQLTFYIATLAIIGGAMCLLRAPPRAATA